MAVQAPIVLIFAFFVWRMEQAQHEANERNHEEWRAFMTKRQEREREERDRWYQFLTSRDREFVKERVEMQRALARLVNQIEHNTKVLLLIFTAIGDDVDINTVPKEGE